MKKLFLALPLVALAACGGGDSTASDKDVLMTSDIDSMVGWLGNPSDLPKGEAHSGNYSLRVDKNHEFSPGYTAILGQLSTTKLRGVKFDAWVYATNKDASGKLEFVLKETAGGKEIMHEQVNLNDVKDYGKWTLVSKEIIFPPNANYLSQVVIYVSRANSTSPAYVDDLKLTALR
ncbi:MAG: hypothetical protein EOO56_23670 [Hymenobacter sp.]|nr:MAG: hypothetical protein EOO56_23670 [Hymenobacter sp.]